MSGNRFINELPLSVPSVLAKVEAFLAANGLRYDPMDAYVAVTEDEDGENILAGGGISGDVIKCVAVCEEVRSEGIMNMVISRLIALASEAGHTSVKVFTKPENLRLFASLGFRLLAQSREAVLMENGGGLSAYLKYLSSCASSLSGHGMGSCGIIVMNANPFTKGHRYLVEQAASRVSKLYVMAVGEDRSRFPYSERLEMIRRGCQGLDNVEVLEGSGYVISSATFPTYFLKNLDTAAETQIDLDLNLFTMHIAPELGVTVRFAGSEPADALTARYNEKMASALPMSGIEYAEIQRLIASDGEPVSASRLRAAMDSGDFAKIIDLACPSSMPFILAALAQDALVEELDTTPKPGLVDRNGNGSHKDMTYASMSAGIKALRPFFAEVAEVAMGYEADEKDGSGKEVCRKELAGEVVGKNITEKTGAGKEESGENSLVSKELADKIREIGVRAEAAMLAATGGVNTHRGALFCLGLSVAAVTKLLTDNRLNEESFMEEVADIAMSIPSTSDSHGAAAVTEYKVAGALENARQGYGFIFKDILPFARSLGADEYRNHKILLKLMAALDDTNVLHRAGLDGLAFVKKASEETLANFSVEAMELMDKEFTKANISPGGAADMLALTVFLMKIFP